MEQQTKEQRFADLRNQLTEAFSKLENDEITVMESKAILKKVGREMKELQKELGISNSKISSTFNLDNMMKTLNQNKHE